jgi:alkylhydroperoxidase/carboxymuconolactone decarboxylase family protein YurZ
MTFDPLLPLKKINPELYETMNKTSKISFSEGKIPVKYKYLIAMALDAAHGATDGVAALAQQAIAAGATEEDIAEVLEVLHYVCGGGSIYTAANGLSGIVNR